MEYDEDSNEDENYDDENIEEHNNLFLSALIEILVEKNIITQDEIDSKMDEIEEREETEEE